MIAQPTAAFTVEPGKVVTGTAAVREAIAGFLANTGEVAMVSSKWKLTGTAPDGSAVDSPWGLA